MSEKQLVDRMSAESGFTMKQSGKALNELMGIIYTELSSGGTVSLIGLGVFCVIDRKFRTAWNPKTGEEMEVRAREIPVFKASPNLRQAVSSR